MPRSKRRQRPAISGIIAALIMFVMLFTIGTGYFLWVSDNNQVYSQALVDRNNSNQAQQSESLSLTPSVPGADIDVAARNTGGVPIIIASIMVTDLSGTVKSMCTSTTSSACGQGINPGGATLPIDTTSPFSTGNSVIIKVLTQRGSVFSTQYLSPTLSTKLSSTSVPAGGSVTDSAKLTGASSTASGTVTYYFSSSSTCPSAGAAVVGSPVNVVNGNIPNSAAQTFSNLGTYYWYAVYSGDTNDASAVSPCEPLTVTAATGASLTTLLSSVVVNTGQPVYDTATLSGATSNAGGTATYYYFSGGTCSGPKTTVGTVTVTNAVIPNSPTVVFVTVGSYSWNATYSGDSNNNAAKSPCEPLTVVSSGGGGSTGSLTQVIGSFKFYFTNCNPMGNSGSCGGATGNGLGDGVLARGYYGYGLSFFGATDCDSDEAPNCNSDVFQITLTNQDPQGRAISLSPQSFLLLQGVCLSQDVCGGQEFGIGFSQGYWIVDGICSPASTCTGLGAVPTPYSSTVTVGPGATVTLYFYCSGPCTTSGSLQAPSNNPPPGTYLAASLNLYGLYSDGTPFGQDIPFISSYVSPVQIVGCATGASISGPSCWSSFNPAEQLTGSPGSQITLSVSGFARQPTNPFPIFVYWVNPTGTTSLVNSATTCDVNNQPCYVTLTVPSAAGTGFYGLYVTSDGVNNAYATVSVLGPTKATTTLSQTSIVVGGSVYDTATLSGVTANAGGQVTYEFFAGSSCQGTASTVPTVTVTNGVVPNSNSHRFDSAGPFSWNAVYTGDGNNNGATSACEPMTVQAASPAISTSLSKSSTPAGQPVSDSATLTGGSASAGGTVTYQYYNNNACSGTPSIVASVTVTNGNVPASGNYYPNSVGTFYFVVVYSGDSNNNPATSACNAEQLIVTVANPNLSTTLIPGSSVVVGTSVSDSATLTGASSTAGGTVAYNYYVGAACSGTATTVSTATVTNGNVPNSAPPLAFNTPGSYSWRATYSGDANDAPATSPCEPLTVNKATPTITTTVSNSGSITIGSSATDQATFTTGFGTLTGTLVFNAYSNTGCSALAFTSGTITVNGNGPYTSNSFTPASAGTYYWKATFTDTDGNNNNVVTTCGSGGPSSETLTASKATPTITTIVTPSSITLGNSAADKGTFSNGFGTLTGTLVFRAYTSSSCSSGLSFTSGTITVNGNGPYTSNSFTPASAGTYYWQATFTDSDGNNNGFTSPCGGAGETLTVVKGALSIIQFAQFSCSPATTNCSSSTLTVPSFSMTSGDTVVVTVSTLRVSSTNCRVVTGVTDNPIGDTFASGGSVTGQGSGNCAASSVWYTTAAGGTASIMVSLSNSLGSSDSAVVEVYDLRNAAPSSLTVQTGSCPPSCAGSGMSTGSPLSIPAGGFVVATGSVCQTSGGSNLQISSVSFSFTNRYGPAPARAQYLGDTVAGSSSSPSFGMTASGTPQCWTVLGATFPDPAPEAGAQTSSFAAPNVDGSSELASQFLIFVALWLVCSPAISWFGLAMRKRGRAKK